MPFDCFANYEINPENEEMFHNFLEELNNSACDTYIEIDAKGVDLIGLVPVALIPPSQSWGNADLLYWLVGCTEIMLCEKGTVDKDRFIRDWCGILTAYQCDYFAAVALNARLRVPQETRATVGIHDLFPVNIRHTHSFSSTQAETDHELAEYSKAIKVYQQMVEAYEFTHDAARIEQAKRDRRSVIHSYFLEEHCLNVFRQLLKARIGTWLLENCQYWLH